MNNEIDTKKNVNFQKVAFVFAIIGLIVPILPIMAIVFSSITMKEKPNNWRSKWGMGLGVVGLISSSFVSLVVISYLFMAIVNVLFG